MGRRNLETNTDEIAGLKIIANIMKQIVSKGHDISEHYKTKDLIDNLNPEQSINVSKALHFINNIM